MDLHSIQYLSCALVKFWLNQISEVSHVASLLLTGYKKLRDNTIVTVGVSLEDSELDS